MKDNILKLLRDGTLEDIEIALNVLKDADYEDVIQHCKNMTVMYSLTKTNTVESPDTVYKLTNFYAFIGPVAIIFFQREGYIPKTWKIIEI